MRKIFATFVLGFGAAAALFVSLSYHFILTDKKWVMEKKSELTFEETFVDTRDWGIGDYLKHGRVTGILIKHGIKNAFGSDSNADKAKEAVEKLKKDAADALDKMKGK